MSCLENDMIMENIADEIWGKVDNGDEGIWQEITEIGYQKDCTQMMTWKKS